MTFEIAIKSSCADDFVSVQSLVESFDFYLDRTSETTVTPEISMNKLNCPYSATLTQTAQKVAFTSEEFDDRIISAFTHSEADSIEGLNSYIQGQVSFNPSLLILDTENVVPYP